MRPALPGSHVGECGARRLMLPHASALTSPDRRACARVWATRRPAPSATGSRTPAGAPISSPTQPPPPKTQSPPPLHLPLTRAADGAGPPPLRQHLADAGGAVVVAAGSDGAAEDLVQADGAIGEVVLRHSPRGGVRQLLGTRAGVGCESCRLALLGSQQGSLLVEHVLRQHMGAQAEFSAGRHQISRMPHHARWAAAPRNHVLPRELPHPLAPWPIPPHHSLASLVPHGPTLR